MTEETSPAVNFSNRKVLIGIPSSDYINIEFFNSLTQLITQTAQWVSLGIVSVVSSRIATNRNNIVKNARIAGATDILWVDSDGVFPVHGLMTLLMHDKDIVCATTCRRKGNDRTPVANAMDMNEVKANPKMARLRNVGFPFMLTKMSVFDKLDELGLAEDGVYFAEPPRNMMIKNGWSTFSNDGLLGEDEYFCYLVRSAGFDIWCDLELSMEIGHVGPTVHYIKNSPDTYADAKNIDEML